MSSDTNQSDVNRSRVALPDRRFCVTVDVAWKVKGGADHKIVVTFGFDENKRIKEAFVAGMRIESGINALANDACILYSRLLQHGGDLNEIATTMVEDRAEGQAQGPSASIMGAIARKAVQIQRELLEQK